MKIYYETLVDYICHNCLIIDKGTYFTIIIGQITIYAILLTFYQFIVSLQGTNDASVKRYLGINLIEYFVYKRLVIYNKIVAKPWFGMLFVLEILYKPLINVYGVMIPKEFLTIFNFFWYTYVVCFFVIFVLLFFQCTKCVLDIKKVVDIGRNANVIRSINKEFRKKTFVEVLTKCSIEMLIDDMKYLRYVIEEENTTELHVQYIRLIIDIFNDYIDKKKNEITLLFTKNKKVKNQIAWIYNMQCECMLLDEFLEEKYIRKNPTLQRYVQKWYLELLDLNLSRAKVEGYEKIAIDVFDSNKDSLDCEEWKNLLKRMYEKASLEDKKRMIEELYRGRRSNNKLFGSYCEKVLLGLIRRMIGITFEEEKNQKDFVYIFEHVVHDDKTNTFYAKHLCDNLISYNETNTVELVKLLSKENATYVFVYLMIYYSIYKFRFDWEYINIAVLKELKRHGNNIKGEFERINNLLSNSHISHRYDAEMYIALEENVNKEITGEWLNDVYQQNSIDAFYITIIKLCVYEQTYCAYYKKGGMKAKVAFVNELAKHKELLMCTNVKEMILRMQYNDFRTLEHWPDELHISLQSMLLMDMPISDEQLNEEFQYCYYKSVGEYLLIKYAGEDNISEVKKELIRKAYVASNMPIEEYVETLYSEGATCGAELNYVKKEKMKNYLVEII